MEELRALVLDFRRIMECLNPSNFDGTSLSASQFPSACCDDSSQILAAYLTDNGFSGATLIRGEYGGNHKELQSHVWLNLGGLKIDITADQFNTRGYDNPSVIIARENEFLETFETTDDGIADFRIHLKDYSDPGLERDFEFCYKVILSHLSAQA
ncbi:hypothetical protein VV869_03165 [Photobacterium sp. MCCC 1A19761]|uniref:hypothetical protein n=1 Tax=Photobacterium sp. MCCC 1A19761 TaxID=3115000 RepID=UPI00307DC490